jgi:DUF4097 and DUF4098 domain-containing protein YvlB
MKRSLFALAVAVLLPFETGCVLEDFGMADRFTEDFHYSYKLEPGARVSVENANGSIEITGWNKDSAEINGTKSAYSQEAAKAIRIDVAQDQGSLTIRTIFPPGSRHGMGAKYEIRVPRDSKLDRIASSNGTIRVEGINGGVSLRTSNGSVHVNNVRGRLVVDTSNGSIAGENLEGDCSLETSNGSIRIDRMRGALVARTTNGSITLSLPPDAKAKVNAETTNGKVTSEFEELASSSPRKNHLAGTIGGGGPQIKLVTTNGSIRLKKS